MNKIMLIGNSCRDCELVTAGDKQYTRINLAVSRSYSKEKADFFDCTVFGKLAEIVVRYVKKGTKVAIVGHIEFNEGKNGVRRHSVVVEDIEFLSSPISDRKADEGEDLPFEI